MSGGGIEGPPPEAHLHIRPSRLDSARARATGSHLRRLPGNRRGAMGFALAAVVLLVLTSVSIAYMGSLGHEADTALPQAQSLRRLEAAADSARLAAEDIALDAALQAIEAVFLRAGDSEEAGGEFATRIGPALAAPGRFPGQIGGLSVTLVRQDLVLEPLVMATATITPVDGKNESMKLNLTGVFQDSSAAPYYQIRGSIDLSLMDPLTHTPLALTTLVQRQVSVPLPLLTSVLKQLALESTGSEQALGRVLVHILTTLAQARIVLGYGSGAPSMPTASQILTVSDVTRALNLALILQQARVTRTLDLGGAIAEFDRMAGPLHNDSIAPPPPNPATASLAALARAYVSNGTIDGGDLMALFYGLDRVTPNSRAISPQDSKSEPNRIVDQYVRQFLDGLGLVTEADPFVLSQFLSNLLGLTGAQQSDLISNIFFVAPGILAPDRIAQWITRFVGTLASSYGLTSALSPGSSLRLLVMDNGRQFTVGPSSESRPYRVLVSSGSCYTINRTRFCPYTYGDRTLNFASANASRALSFADQDVTVGRDAVWAEFLAFAINGTSWEDLANRTVRSVFGLFSTVVDELNGSIAKASYTSSINPNDETTFLESMAGQFNATVSVATQAVRASANVTRAASAMGDNTTALLSRLMVFMGTVPPAASTCRGYASWYDCLVSSGQRIGEAATGTATSLLQAASTGSDPSLRWQTISNGTCTTVNGSGCPSWYSTPAAAESVFRADSSVRDSIANQIRPSVQAAFDQVRGWELDAFRVPTSSMATALADSLIAKAVGAPASLLDRQAAYLQRSVDFGFFDRVLPTKILESAAAGRDFQFWSGNVTDSVRAGVAHNESLAVTQNPTYLEVQNVSTLSDYANGTKVVRQPGQIVGYLSPPRGLAIPGDADKTAVPYQTEWDVCINGTYEISVGAAGIVRPLSTVAVRESIRARVVVIDICSSVVTFSARALKQVNYVDPNSTPDAPAASKCGIGSWQEVKACAQKVVDYFKALAKQVIEWIWPGLFESDSSLLWPLTRVLRSEIAISQMMGGKMASAYSDGDLAGATSAIADKIQQAEVQWATEDSIVGTIGGLKAIINDAARASKFPYEFSFLGHQVVASLKTSTMTNFPNVTRVRTDASVNRGLEDPKDFLLRLDVTPAAYKMTSGTDPPPRSVTIWLIEYDRPIFMFGKTLTGFLAPVSAFHAKGQAAEVEFVADPLQIRQPYFLAGAVKWTAYGLVHGASVRLPDYELSVSVVPLTISNDAPLKAGLAFKGSVTINFHPEPKTLASSVFINELAFDRSSTPPSGWIEIWHPGTDHGAFMTAGREWLLVAARSGASQKLGDFGGTSDCSASVGGASSATSGSGRPAAYTICKWSGGAGNTFHLAPGDPQNPLNPTDGLLLIDSNGAVLDSTPFQRDACSSPESFQRLMDGSTKWDCLPESPGVAHLVSPIVDCCSNLLGFANSIPGVGALLAPIRFLEYLATFASGGTNLARAFMAAIDDITFTLEVALVVGFDLWIFHGEAKAGARLSLQFGSKALAYIPSWLSVFIGDLVNGPGAASAPTKAGLEDNIWSDIRWGFGIFAGADAGVRTADGDAGALQVSGEGGWTTSSTFETPPSTESGTYFEIGVGASGDHPPPKAETISANILGFLKKYDKKTAFGFEGSLSLRYWLMKVETFVVKPAEAP
jgi:hypothetical protein